MAGTRIAARKSTGGQAPRKQLVTTAARKMNEATSVRSAQDSSSSSEEESSDSEQLIESIPPEYHVPQGQCPKCGSLGILGMYCETCQNKRYSYEPIYSSEEES